MNNISVTVPQAYRSALQKTLRELACEVVEEGYTDGSTSWTCLVQTSQSIEDFKKVVYPAYEAVSNGTIRIEPYRG